MLTTFPFVECFLFVSYLSISNNRCAPIESFDSPFAQTKESIHVFGQQQQNVVISPLMVTKLFQLHYILASVFFYQSFIFEMITWWRIDLDKVWPEFWILNIFKYYCVADFQCKILHTNYSNRQVININSINRMSDCGSFPKKHQHKHSWKIPNKSKLTHIALTHHFTSISLWNRFWVRKINCQLKCSSTQCSEQLFNIWRYCIHF